MRFLVGFILGVLVSVLGSFAWIVDYGGGDYVLNLSPKFQEMESSVAALEKRVNDLSERVSLTESPHRPTT